jgi:hypothetical protein
MLLSSKGWAIRIILLSSMFQFLPRYSQVVPSPKGQFANQCIPAGNETNPFHSYQGVQIPIQIGTLSPQYLRPSFSAVLKPPPNNPPITVGPKRAGTHDKRVTSLVTPISKYMLRIISLWPDYHPQQWTVLNRHRQDNCNLSLAQLPTRSTSKIQSRLVSNYYSYIFHVIVIW